MRDAVELNGGRIDEDEYLNEVQRLIAEEGGSTSISSLRSNGFSRTRMDDAGIVRVSIGSQKQIWLRSQADDILAGTPVSFGGSPTNFVEAPETTDDGTFFGIRRRQPDEYPEHLQAYIIPRGSLQYVESEKGEMRLMAVAFKAGFNVSMDGPKGCGKTMAMKAFAMELGIPFVRINCSEGFVEEHFIGYQTIQSGEVVWVDGVLPLSIRYGAFLCFDEFRSARPEIMTAWNPVGDSGTLVLPQNENEVVVAHEDFRTFATMNPLEGYSGGQDINQATSDRFDMALTCTYLPADAEMRVVQEQSGINNPALARQFVQLANHLRNLKAEHDLESDTSTRMIIAMMTASETLNMTEMVDYIMLGRYSPHEQEVVKTTARAVLSDY